jgi:hypothetical protein
MAWLNGRLPRSALAPITRAVNGEQAYLARNAAKAFMAMNAESEHRFGVTLRVGSARVAYRPLADQQYFWNLYISGRGALAARPGTSNHGWGLAVDLATPQMRHIVDEIGAKYGWAKKWSDAPTEWWHIKYRPGVWNGKSQFDHPVLKRGSFGRKVIRLKKLMWAHGLRGFNRHLPGFGPGVEAAIKRLQKKHHLKPDGVVGPKTWEILGKN